MEGFHWQALCNAGASEHRRAQTRIKQHSVARHLARSENDEGDLTVIRRSPEMKVLRRQAPESVGVGNLNNWRDIDYSGR